MLTLFSHMSKCSGSLSFILSSRLNDMKELFNTINSRGDEDNNNEIKQGFLRGEDWNVLCEKLKLFIPWFSRKTYL